MFLKNSALWILVTNNRLNSQGSAYHAPSIAMHAVLDSWTLPNASSTAASQSPVPVLLQWARTWHARLIVNPLGLAFTTPSSHWAARPEPYAALFSVALAARAVGSLLAWLLCAFCGRARAGSSGRPSSPSATPGAGSGGVQKLSKCALLGTLLLVLALALVMLLLRVFLRTPASSLLLIGAMFFYGLLFSTLDSSEFARTFHF